MNNKKTRTISAKISYEDEQSLSKYALLIKKLFPEKNLKDGKSCLAGMFINYGIQLFRESEDRLNILGNHINEVWDMWDRSLRRYALIPIKIIIDNLPDAEKILFKTKIKEYLKSKKFKNKQDIEDLSTYSL